MTTLERIVELTRLIDSGEERSPMVFATLRHLLGWAEDFIGYDADGGPMGDDLGAVENFKVIAAARDALAMEDAS